MDILLIDKPIDSKIVEKAAEESFGEMVKAVIDIKKEIIALGGEMHADGEAFLLEQGSLQADLWGINLYPFQSQEEMIEYTSLINIRPSIGNRSMEIENLQIRAKILQIVGALIK